MDTRLEQVCKELNEDLSPEVAQVIDDFLKDRPDYTLERLKSEFEFLNNVVKNGGKLK